MFLNDCYAGLPSQIHVFHRVARARLGKAATAMSLRRHATRLSAASVAPIFAFLLRFLRTAILSRLLLPGDVGAAVVLTSILGGCEMITDVGLDQFVIVSRGDDRAQIVAVARQISIARAVLLAAAIALLARPLASLFGAGDLHQIVAWIGVAPLIKSLKNWRIIQIQQEYRYGAEAVSIIGGLVAALIVIIPANALFHDERVMLCSLITDAVVSVGLSNILAPRQRVVRVDPALRRSALLFGLPLMANGVGLVVLKQFDQVIVANLFGLSTLAFYTLALNLAIMPTSVLQSVAAKISLPFLGARRNDTTSKQASLIVILGMMIPAAGFAILIGLSLDWLTPLVYGPEYQVSAAFSALAMLAAFLRFSRGGPNMVLLDHGQTKRLTAGNMIAAGGLLVAFLLGLATRRLEGVLVGIVLGDLLSFVSLLALLRRHLPMTAMLQHAFVLGSTVAAAAVPIGLEPAAGWEIRAVILLVGALIVGADAAAIYLRIIVPFAGEQPQAPGPSEVREIKIAWQSK